jgi:hypothetical protein
MRTLVRAGRIGVLVRLESRRGTQFLVAGPEPDDRRLFYDATAAARSFEQVERGLRRPAERRLKRRSVVRRVATLFPRRMTQALAPPV